ncbi:hypothetical protein BS614_26295 [Paenibacillus xylanexedens]|uniref:hypothetical protein n=1 Tax=Paenibacillus xylanexedens TaxID=528191 RepID=UPI00093880E5|nr:hypothetical protein [Paenibacillus xylanexedens]APO47215.1 hypothetical protein BS614_26295 [Paenibacillus xylanexedens]
MNNEGKLLTLEVEANQPVQTGLKDIVQFNVPSGAIGSKDALQISVVAKDKLQNTSSLNVLGQAVQISRSGGRTLNDQAELSINVASADLPNGTQPAIYYYNEARQSWLFIGGKTNAAGSITANVNHLGTFVVSSYTRVNLFT